jgi:hypothetical protein
MDTILQALALLDGLLAVCFAAAGRFDLATFLMATGAFVRS